MKLFGTTTSPFVRRVRVVCLERALPFSLVPALTDEGQAALRKVSPVWKVPVAEFDDGRVVFDSRVIIAELCHDGWAPLRAPATDPQGRVREENLVTMIDEAVLCLVRRLYLQKDGAPLDAPYLKKDHERAATILASLEHVVADGGVQTADTRSLGLPELALVTGLDWIAFRQMFDLTTTPALRAFSEAWQAHPSFAATRPAP